MIFNREYIKNKRHHVFNCHEFNGPNYLFSYGEQIILDLIEDLHVAKIKDILVYGKRGDFPINAMKNYLKDADIEEKFYLAPEVLEKKYDLIISFFDISSIDNLAEFFSVAFMGLKDNGVFLGTFIGENSLMNGRQKLWKIESELSGRYAARLWPMVKLEDLTRLIQRAGFSNVISFIDKYEHKYSNLYEFIRDIRKMGESGGLKQTEYFPKFLYNKLKATTIGSYIENFELINFCAAKTTKIFASQVNI